MQGHIAWRTAAMLCMAVGEQRPCAAQASTTYVYYSHSLGAGGALRYSPPGTRDSARLSGLAKGDKLNIDQGGKVCFVVARANPLFYTYSVGTSVVTVAQPAGLADLLKSATAGISALGPGASLVAAGPAAQSPTETETVLSERVQVRADSVTMAQSSVASALKVQASAVTHAARQQADKGVAAATGKLRLQEQKYAIAESLVVSEQGRATITSYAQSLKELIDVVNQIETNRAQSIRMDRFQVMAPHIDSLRDTEKKESSQIDTIYKQLLSDTTLMRHQGGSQLRFLQQMIDSVSVARVKEFDDAAALADKLGSDQTSLCSSPLKSDRIRVGLSIKATTKTDVDRDVGDTVTYVLADPVSTADFELGAGALLAVGINASKFAVKNGLIAQSFDNGPIFHPGVFAMGRLGVISWLWAAVGAAKGTVATPDLFIGLIARSGSTVVGTHVSVGAGLALAQVPTGLSQGTVGSALPTNVTDIDNIISRSYKSGLGLTFTVSGLDFSK
jgi:hypothetical protein